MLVNEIMTKSPSCCEPSTPACDVARLMKQEDTGVLPVVEADGRLVGMVTDRDICLAVVAEGRDSRHTMAGDCMTGAVVSCRPSEDVDQVLALLQRDQIRRVPVVDEDGRVIGIVSIGDLSTHHATTAGRLASTLESVSMPARRSPA